MRRRHRPSPLPPSPPPPPPPPRHSPSTPLDRSDYGDGRRSKRCVLGCSTGVSQSCFPPALCQILHSGMLACILSRCFLSRMLRNNKVRGQQDIGPLNSRDAAMRRGIHEPRCRKLHYKPPLYTHPAHPSVSASPPLHASMPPQVSTSCAQVHHFNASGTGPLAEFDSPVAMPPLGGVGGECKADDQHSWRCRPPMTG